MVFHDHRILHIVDVPIWLDIPRSVAHKRRKRTKPAAGEYFEDYIWPNHESYIARVFEREEARRRIKRLDATESTRLVFAKAIDIVPTAGGARATAALRAAAFAAETAAQHSYMFWQPDYSFRRRTNPVAVSFWNPTAVLKQTAADRTDAVAERTTDTERKSTVAENFGVRPLIPGPLLAGLLLPGQQKHPVTALLWNPTPVLKQTAAERADVVVARRIGAEHKRTAADNFGVRMAAEHKRAAADIFGISDFQWGSNDSGLAFKRGAFGKCAAAETRTEGLARQWSCST